MEDDVTGGKWRTGRKVGRTMTEIDVEEYRRVMAEMRRTHRCVPPGHAWPGHPATEPTKPGPCVCGKEWIDQDMIDTTAWCEP